MAGVTYSVGTLCEALWADDGKHYPAEVLSVFTRKDIEMCRVKFLDYDDEAEVRASDLKPPAKPQRPQKQANSKATPVSASPVPRQQPASVSASAAPVSNGVSAASLKASDEKTPKAKAATPTAAPSSDLDSELKRLQSELRLKEEEDEREKQTAHAEMKKLADRLLQEGFVRQATLADLKAREERIKHQIALLSKSALQFGESQGRSNSSDAAVVSSAATSANYDAADVPRCIEGIKKLQSKNHDGTNEAVFVSQLGLVLNPKIDGLKQFLVSFPQHFDVVVSEGPSPRGKATIASVKLK